MSPHQFFPQWRCVPDKAQDWVTVSTNCYAMHPDAMYDSYTGVNTPSTAPKTLHVSGYGTAKYYTTTSSSYSSRSYWSCSRLHGSPPTYRLGLPPDKNAGCPSSLNLPSGRSDPPDKEITYNCMNGSPGDPPGSVVQQSKKQKNRPFHNLSRGRSDRQGGRAGDNYRRYKTCH
jgi:hypothetical protein